MLNQTSTSSDIQIKSLIEQQNYTEAIKILKGIINEEPDPEKTGLLGLAYFRSEQYSIIKFSIPDFVQYTNQGYIRIYVLKKLQC